MCGCTLSSVSDTEKALDEEFWKSRTACVHKQSLQRTVPCDKDTLVTRLRSSFVHSFTYRMTTLREL